MNILQRTLIEKVGHDNGFEHIVAINPEKVGLASARHRNRVEILTAPAGFYATFQSVLPSLHSELKRQFPNWADGGGFAVPGEAALAQLLRRAAELSRSLPSQAAIDYDKAVHDVLLVLPEGIFGTEVERMVRQRIGQDKFRDAMLDYWDGACAVTGVAVPEVLRASHAKQWADCDSDAERLDVFNGFLLSANLDALFDRFLISFDENGQVLISSSLSETDRRLLGLSHTLKLRWIAAEHQRYLTSHRALFTQSRITDS